MGPISIARAAASLTRWIVGGALAAALLAGLARPAQADVVRLSDIAERFGFTERRVQLLSGRQVLEGGGNQLAVVPGGHQLMVNGSFLTLKRPVGCYEGDLTLDKGAVAFIEANLHAPPAPPVAPPPAPPAPTPSAPPPSVTPQVERVATPGTIVIDPGHGGEYRGTKGSALGLLEKDVNLGIAIHMKRMLEERGWRVVLTRMSDRELSASLNADLEARIGIANRMRSDLFVSIHANHSQDRSVEGFEVYQHGGGDSERLARAIHGSLRARLDADDRGVKSARFRVLRLARVPATLVEVGFLSHAETERKLAQDAYRQRVAAAVVDGILRYREAR